jgi:DNA-directed RNA polymerase subunit RPC12/RpoP
MRFTMAAKVITNRGSETKLVHVLSRDYVYASATMFAIMGLVTLFSASGDVSLLRQEDALFGVTTRVLLLLTGILHLAISTYLFAGRDLMNRGIAVLWAGTCHIYYLVGMVVMKIQSPFPAVMLVAWKVGVSAKVIGILWILLIAFFLLGGVMLLALEWRRLKQVEQEMYLQRWSKMREHKWHGKLSEFLNVTKSKASKSALPEFTFSCPSCGQHISCNVTYSGKQVTCPSCNGHILVPQEAASKK